MFLRFGFLFLLIISCEPSHKSILRLHQESILHDNSSKIWIINKVKKKGVNYGKMQLTQKDVAIFFESGKVYFQPITTLGNFPKRYGKFYLNSENKTLFIDFNDEKWYFQINSINSKQVVLKHSKKSDFQYDLEFISYPEEK